MKTPKYRLQIEFDFNSDLDPEVVLDHMYEYFKARLDEWNSANPAGMMRDMSYLNVEVADN